MQAKSDEVETTLLFAIASRYTAQPFSPFALMPRGQLLSCVTKVTSSSSQPIVRRLQLALLGEPCTGAVDQITDLDSTAKDTNKGLCPLFIPKGLCSATKDAPKLPEYDTAPTLR